MTRYYNNDERLGESGPYDFPGCEPDEALEEAAEQLCKIFDDDFSSMLAQVKKAFSPAVVIEHSRGAWLAKDHSDQWVWVLNRDLAWEFPSDSLELKKLDVLDGEVCPEHFYSNATDAEFLDVGWGDEDGSVFARAVLS